MFDIFIDKIIHNFDNSVHPELALYLSLIKEGKDMGSEKKYVEILK